MHQGSQAAVWRWPGRRSLATDWQASGDPVALRGELVAHPLRGYLVALRGELVAHALRGYLVAQAKNLAAEMRRAGSPLRVGALPCASRRGDPCASTRARGAREPLSTLMRLACRKQGFGYSGSGKRRRRASGLKGYAAGSRWSIAEPALAGCPRRQGWTAQLSTGGRESSANSSVPRAFRGAGVSLPNGGACRRAASYKLRSEYVSS